MILDGVDGRRATFGLAHHAHQAGLLQHHVGELVHTGGGSGAGRADRFVTNGVNRAHVVDEAILEVHRQGFTLAQHFLNTLVGGIAAGQQLAGQQHGFAHFPLGNVGAGHGIQVDPAHVFAHFPGHFRPVFQLRRRQLGGA